MPAKTMVNHHAAGYAQTLSHLASETYKGILKGAVPAYKILSDMERALASLRKELNLIPPPDMGDPFLTEGPKSDVAKLPTVHVEAVKEPEPVKKGFLQRG